MSKRQTIPQLRSRFSLDMVQLAHASGLTTATVYRALLRQPVHDDEADKLMDGLKRLTGTQWTQKTLDIVRWSDQHLLWIVRATPHPVPDTLSDDKYTLIYARDLAHAIELSTPWHHQQTAHSFISVTPNPHGYHIGTLHIPGYISSPREQEKV